MMGVTRNGWTAYGLAVLVILLDQLTKQYIVGVLQLPIGATLPFLGPLQFTRVANAGVSYGLLQASGDVARWLLIAFSFAVAILLGLWARRAGRLMPALGLGLVMGGAIGNAIDRARFGAVVDFVDVEPLLTFFPWKFNVADSAISVGVVLLLLDSLRRERPA